MEEIGGKDIGNSLDDDCYSCCYRGDIICPYDFSLYYIRNNKGATGKSNGSKFGKDKSFL